MVTGFIVSSILRALLIAFLILGVGYLMVHTLPRDWVLYFAMTVLVSTLFGSIGIIFGLFAEKFDHIAVFTTFVITPLVFVGGVFTSSQFLPPFVREISLFNPMFYMIDAFRYSFTGRSDMPVELSLAIVLALTFASLATALRLTAIGFKLRV
jgi:ABC-2 type transport system permease protein